MDFESMTETELRAFRFEKQTELRALRDLIREAGLVLHRKRAEIDRAEYEASVALYGAEAVAAASIIVVAPPASASGGSFTGGVSSP